MKINSFLAIAAFMTLSFSSTVANANPFPGGPNAPLYDMGQNCMGQNCMGQDCMGQNYRGGGYPNHHMGQPHHERGMFLKQLKLTEAQQLQMEEIRLKYEPEFSQLHSQLFQFRQELHNMMAANNSNDALRAKHEEILQLRQEMDNLRFQSMLEVREILTPEQRNELGQIMQQN